MFFEWNKTIWICCWRPKANPYNLKWNLLPKDLTYFLKGERTGWMVDSRNLQQPRVYGHIQLDKWSGDDAKMLTTLSDPQVVQVSSVEDGWNVSWQKLLESMFKEQLRFVMFFFEKCWLKEKQKSIVVACFAVFVCHKLSCLIVCLKVIL